MNRAAAKTLIGNWRAGIPGASKVIYAWRRFGWSGGRKGENGIKGADYRFRTRVGIKPEIPENEDSAKTQEGQIKRSRSILGWADSSILIPEETSGSLGKRGCANMPGFQESQQQTCRQSRYFKEDTEGRKTKTHFKVQNLLYLQKDIRKLKYKGEVSIKSPIESRGVTKLRVALIASRAGFPRMREAVRRSGYAVF